MPAPRFVHLRLHSEYSVTDGIVRLEDAVRRAVQDGMPALALTDSANLFGMVKFYRAARAGDGDGQLVFRAGSNILRMERQGFRWGRCACLHTQAREDVLLNTALLVRLGRGIEGNCQGLIVLAHASDPDFGCAHDAKGGLHGRDCCVKVLWLRHKLRKPLKQLHCQLLVGWGPAPPSLISWSKLGGTGPTLRYYWDFNRKRDRSSEPQPPSLSHFATREAK